MSYSILTTSFFEKEYKKLLRKYATLPKDFQKVINLLKEDHKSGESIGNNCYKIRMSIAAKNKGKSGGARVVTHVRFVNEEIFLVSIYDKSELSNITDEEILLRIKGIK